MIPSYGKIWALGSTPVVDLLRDPVVVQEKIDGSQISFRVTTSGELLVKSKNVQLVLDNAGMFQEGVNALLEIKDALVPNVTYRGEYLRTTKHNHLAYARLPKRHVVLWDIQLPDGSFDTCREDVSAEAFRLGLDLVPEYFRGRLEHAGQIEQYLGQLSLLGGSVAEGVVVKNYERFDPKLGTPLFAKLVREDFKEDQKREWKTENPSGTDIRKLIGQSLQSPARWRKAVQYLKEAGEYTGTSKDIGKLMQRVSTDIDEEQRAEVAEQLMKWAWKEVKRISLHGLPEWFKTEIAEGT